MRESAAMDFPRRSRSTSRRFLLASCLIVPCAVAAFVAGCGDDDPVTPADAGADTGLDGNKPDTSTPVNDTGAPDTATPDNDSGPADAGPSDAADDGATGAAQVARGKYLVENVVGCGDCHTPRLPTGAPDTAKLFAGVDCFIDVDPSTDAGGCLHSANLTNDPTGLKNRTDVQIKDMFLNGKRPDGKFLSDVMPYYALHNLTSEDADAIVAFLRTLPAVAHTVPANQAPFANIPAAATPIEPTTIPGPADAGNGRYLAQFACLECHTPELPPGSVRPINMAKPFAGGRVFPRDLLGLPPQFPENIITSNITQHPTTGISTWTVEDIRKAMVQAKDRTDGGICPPMPAGPMAAFGGLTAQDALDIATYIKSLPGVDNAIDGGNGSCVSPF